MKFRGTCLLVFLALGLNAYAQAPDLQTAGTFAVLAGAGVDSADAGTTIVGDVGSSPTPAVTGLSATQVTGKLYTAANAVLTTAQSDLTAAYLDAAGRSSCTPIAGALGGATNPNLGPGVYCFSSEALLTGTLTLAGTGSSTDVWIFQIGSTLTTATGATVALAGGALPCNVFWQVGTTATIQTGNSFVGTIMALTSIALDGGTLSGRALARNGAVTISGQETIINGCSVPPIVPTIVLSPVNSSVICGSSITKTAVVLSNGLPLAGTIVTFTVTAGPDTGQSGTATTDASGTASISGLAPLLTSSAGDSVVATINGGTVSSNTTTATCSDSNPTAPFPTVTLTGMTPGPPKQVVFSVQASGGLFSVVADTPPTTNATVVISSFDTGTTQILGVTATKIDQSASAVVQLTVTDLLGHVTVFDPVYATITIPSAAVDSDSAADSDSKSDSKSNSKSHHAEEFNFNHREVVTFDGIGRTEGIVSLLNGTPGVESLVIRVNGSQFRTRLSDGKTKKIDISSALLHGTNTVTVAVLGDPGSSVDLTISGGN